MNINLCKEIIILKDRKTVFDYIANLENDRFWRKEINGTTMNAKPQLNALAEENSFLSKRRPNSILNLKCTSFIENELIIYQTIPDSKFFLKSTRQVKNLSENKTLFIYTIEFDKTIVTDALGLALPSFIVRLAANSDMKKYLKKLKLKLESR